MEIKIVMSSAVEVEAEITALIMITTAVVPIRNNLIKIGHPQTQTKMKTNKIIVQQME